MNTLDTKEKSPAVAAQKSQTGQRIEYLNPRINLHQDGEGFTLEAEMPGVDKKGVEIVVEDGRLVLTGRRQAGSSPGHSVYSERRSGDYRRAFDLDPSIDAERISARIEQGLLAVHLPKVETAKPRKITVS